LLYRLAALNAPRGLTTPATFGRRLRSPNPTDTDYEFDQRIARQERLDEDPQLEPEVLRLIRAGTTRDAPLPEILPPVLQPAI